MFDRDLYLATQRQRVESALDGWLPAEADEPTLLHRAMRYAVFTGGKRLRPILSMAAAAACGAKEERGLRCGCAVEVLHTYTLIHDDLPCMDDDSERRGQPTVHIAFGESTAVLAGDALQALAFEWLTMVTELSRWSVADLVRELAVAAGSHGVVGGQVADLDLGTAAPTADQIAFIHLHKTADLFRAALRMGAMAANATPEQVEALTRYAVQLGLAFQITDDLLDAPIAGSAPTEATCLSIYTPAEARQRVTQLIADAHNALMGMDNSGVRPLAAIADFIPLRGH
ncbi:MAG: polyprenyl synthetase family protein [Lentisphaerae bacterium]|nr:polyprenyl synthetase family protein [Lentisphaerota bacterium]